MDKEKKAEKWYPGPTWCIYNQQKYYPVLCTLFYNKTILSWLVQRSTHKSFSRHFFTFLILAWRGVQTGRGAAWRHTKNDSKLWLSTPRRARRRVQCECTLKQPPPRYSMWTKAAVTQLQTATIYPEWNALCLCTERRPESHTSHSNVLPQWRHDCSWYIFWSFEHMLQTQHHDRPSVTVKRNTYIVFWKILNNCEWIHTD